MPAQFPGGRAPNRVFRLGRLRMRGQFRSPPLDRTAVGPTTADAAGTAAGVGAASAALSGVAALAGTSAGSSAPAGAIAAVALVAGASAGVAGGSGAAVGIGALAGSSAGVAGGSGTLSTGPTTVSGQGTAPGQAGGSAAITGLGAEAGAGAGGAGGAGAATGVGAEAGSSAGSGGAVGGLTARAAAGGAASGTAGASGSETALGALGGTTAGSGGAAGAETARGALSGAAAGASAATGAVTARGALAGTAAGHGAATGNLTDPSKALGGTAAGTSTASGTLTVGRRELVAATLHAVFAGTDTGQRWAGAYAAIAKRARSCQGQCPQTDALEPALATLGARIGAALDLRNAALGAAGIAAALRDFWLAPPMPFNGGGVVISVGGAAALEAGLLSMWGMVTSTAGSHQLAADLHAQLLEAFTMSVVVAHDGCTGPLT